MKSFNKFMEERAGPAVTTWDDWTLKYPKTPGVIEYKKQYKEYLDDLEGFLEFKLGTKHKYIGDGASPPKTWYEYVALQGKNAEEHWDNAYALAKQAGLSFNNSQSSGAQHEPPLLKPASFYTGEDSIPFPNQYKTILTKSKIIDKKPIRMIN